MILVIGDTSELLATWTINKFGAGQLANNSNYSALVDAVYFTALGDLSFDQIKTLALSAKEVYYVDNLPWIDKDALIKTQVLCNHLSQFRSIIGFTRVNPRLFLTVSVDRKYSEPTMWTFGCSHTLGAGLTNPETEVYGKLLADQLGMPWQNIAQAGTSTRWSLAHLLQANIESNDIVIWATTSAERVRIATNLVRDYLLPCAGKDAVAYYTDDQIIFEHLDCVNTGVTYLRATNTKFVLLDLLMYSPYFDRLELEFSNYKEWCPTPDWYNHDIGNDGIHIGPIGQQKLAERIYNHIQLLGYDKSI